MPLWANFYNYTDLSHTTTTTIPLDQLTNWMTSTLNQASPAEQVETEVEAEVEAEVETEVEAEVEAG